MISNSTKNYMIFSLLIYCSRKYFLALLLARSGFKWCDLHIKKKKRKTKKWKKVACAFHFYVFLDTGQILTKERVICSCTIWLAQHHISVSLVCLIGLTFSCCCVSWSTWISYINEKYVRDLSDHNICNWKNDSGYVNLWLLFALVAVCHDPPVFPVKIIHICDLSNHNICNWKKWQ